MGKEQTVRHSDRDWQGIAASFSEISNDGLQFIHRAYDRAYKAHKNSPPRKTGDAYITHPTAVANTLYGRLGIRDTDMLAAAFLHDTLEDTPAFVHTRKYPNSVSRAMSRLVIVHEFNEKTARLVMGVSKAKVERKEIANKAKRDEQFERDLPKEQDDVLILKLGDVYHNNLTRKALGEKEAHSIAEVRKFYLPLFKLRLYHLDPKIAALIDEIEQSLPLEDVAVSGFEVPIAV